jgi:hypothetical protein
MIYMSQGGWVVNLNGETIALDDLTEAALAHPRPDIRLTLTDEKIETIRAEARRMGWEGE